MTTAAATMNSRATTISTQHVRTSPRALSSRVICLFRDKTSFLHQRAMRVIGVLYPVDILLARHERVVEGRFLDELLPLGKRAHFLKEGNVEVDLLLRHARRHE